MRIADHSFRHAKEWLLTRPELHASLLAVIVNAQEAQIRSPRNSLTEHLRREFLAEGWRENYRLVQGELHAQHFDFFKGGVAIEIEFSRYEFIYRAFIRFMAAYNANRIDVGVIITNTQNGLERIKCKSSRPNYERLLEELNWLRPTLTVPLWVIGLK